MCNDKWIPSPGHDGAARGGLSWKLHRLFLKHPIGWRSLVLGRLFAFRVKYLAEGRCNYLFRVRDDHRLLRITRKQFYNPVQPVDTPLAMGNGRVMNSLSGAGLSVESEHVYGGALLVEHAGEKLRRQHLQSRQELSDFFTRLLRWSLAHGMVVLDYNEGNWCCREGVIRLVDVDVNFMCALSEIKAHPLVRKRVRVEDYGDGIPVLEAFLREEERLLWNHLAEDGGRS